jgi:hypothetical protein
MMGTMLILHDSCVVLLMHGSMGQSDKPQLEQILGVQVTRCTAALGLLGLT